LAIKSTQPNLKTQLKNIAIGHFIYAEVKKQKYSEELNDINKQHE